MLGIADPLDRGDRASLSLARKQDAGIDGPSIKQHRADAALCFQAVLLGAHHADLVAQDLQQRPMGLDEQLMALAIDNDIENFPVH
nr:hypothetical protein [Bradyrhizobium vignae]